MGLRTEIPLPHMNMSHEMGLHNKQDSVLDEAEQTGLNANFLMTPPYHTESSLNGLRRTPIEKPLRVIINKNEPLEQNGRFPHPLPASIVCKTVGQLLLQEDITKAHSSTTHSPHNTAVNVNSRLETPRGVVRHEELYKRKTVVERIGKLREKGMMDVFIPEMESATALHLGMSIRKALKRRTPFLPTRIRDFVLEDAHIKMQPAKKAETEESRRRLLADPDATDTEDLDPPVHNSSAGTSFSDEYKIRLGMSEQRIIDKLEWKTKELENLKTKLKNSEKGWRLHEARDAEFSRTVPVNKEYRHRLIHISPVDDSYLQPSTSKVSQQNGKWLADDIGQQLAAYLHKADCMPSLVLRKSDSSSASIFRNVLEVEEEKLRNGVRSQEAKEMRLKRRMEGGGESDSYEETDAEDDDFVAPAEGKGRVLNGGDNYKKKKKERKKRKKREKLRMREGFNPPLPLTKIGRRTSGAATYAGGLRIAPASARPSFELDDMPFEPAVLNLPQKMEYKEICIPSWRELDSQEFSDLYTVSKKEEIEVDESQQRDKEEESLSIAVARLHHPLEFDERRRFQAFRDSRAAAAAMRGESKVLHVAAAARADSQTPQPDSAAERGDSQPPQPAALSSRRGSLTSQPEKTRTPPISSAVAIEIPAFDPSKVMPYSNYERTSIVPPYSPRSFN